MYRITPARPGEPPRDARGAPPASTSPRVASDALPHPRGEAPWQLLCNKLTPPMGLVGLGAIQTVQGYHRRCPVCGKSWCLLAPSAVDPFGYFLDALGGCGRGCHAAEIARLYHVDVLAELPPLAPDVVAARKMHQRTKRLLEDLVAGAAGGPPPAPALARAAFEVGTACAVGGLDEDVLLNALVNSGRRLGLAELTGQQVAFDGFRQGWNDAWGLH